MKFSDYTVFGSYSKGKVVNILFIMLYNCIDKFSILVVSVVDSEKYLNSIRFTFGLGLK